MPNITMNDVLAATYRMVEPLPTIRADNTALLIIDSQYLATPDYLAERGEAAGLAAADVTRALGDYRQRFASALASCATLLAAARAHGIPPIHVKIEALSADARDTGVVHRRMGWCFPPGSAGARFLPETAPNAGEIVLMKTVSGAFTGTNLERVLVGLGTQHLFVCGFMTDECVETTARVALDLGYLTYLIGDATTTYHAANHAHVVAKFAGWGLARSAADVKALFEDLSRSHED